MQARKVHRVRSALADSPERVSQRTQAEEAGAALSRALGGRVTHDPGGLAYAAGGFMKEADHAAAERESAPAQRDRVKRQVPGLVGVDPRAEVAAEQDGAHPVRTAAGRIEDLAHRCSGLDLEHARR